MHSVWESRHPDSNLGTRPSGQATRGWISVSSSSLARLRRPQWRDRKEALARDISIRCLAVTEIFVDATGRRRRRMRRIAYAVGATCLIYTGLVGTSVVGEPAGPVALEPFPVRTDRPPVRPTPVPTRPFAAVLPEQDLRRSAPRRINRTASAPERVAARADRVAVATRSPAPRLESTPTPTPSGTTTPPPPIPVPTSPPAPPQPTTPPPTTEAPATPIPMETPEPEVPQSPEPTP
jgi:hypothetical protein